jgi:phage terminase large subunit
VEFIHSTYKDNPFLSKKYIKILEDLEFIDDALYQIYALGKWAQLPDIIYRNYVEAPCDGIFDEIWYGLDFGFNHPTALVQMGMRGGELYVKELIYKSHMTNRDLIDEMGRLEIDTRSPMYADSAEPARIEEIYRAGYNIHPAEKKVDDGIDSVKRHKLHIDPGSVNLLKERMTYKWMTDKNGNTLDKPVKFNDDCMDAMRYGIYTHLIDDDKPDAYTPRGH